MTQTLNINVNLTQVGDSLNATYALGTGSNASAAKLDMAGNIDLSNVADTVDITWTLVGAPNHRFMPVAASNPQTGGPFRWSPKNPGNPGQEDGLGWTVDSVSSNGQSLTVTDTNLQSEQATPFTYSLWLAGGDQLDPSIINR